MLKEIIGVEPLTRDNHEDWFEWLKMYLMAQDLWEVVDESSARPDMNLQKEEYSTWQRKNAAALHIIYVSCGPHNLSIIKEIARLEGAAEAKMAWHTLSTIYNPDQSFPQEIMDEQLAVLCRTISDNNLSETRALIARQNNDIPGLLAQKLTSSGETALHVAAKYGHVRMVEELVRLVPAEHLEILDSSGLTPLATAVLHCGAIRVAECMVKKNRKILVIPAPLPLSGDDDLPVTRAFYVGHNEMGRYLYQVTPLEVITESSARAALLMHFFLKTNDLDLALHLLQRRPEVIFEGHFVLVLSTIEFMAYYLTHFLNKTYLVFWKRWIYHCMNIPSTTSINHHLHVEIQQEDQTQKIQELGFIHRLISFIYKLSDSIHRLISVFYKVSGMKEIRELKLQHKQAEDILNIVCENVKFLEDTKKGMVLKSLLIAAMEGNAEFLLRVSKASPESAWLVTLKALRYGGIFFKAVECRQAEVFNLIHGFRFKNLAAMEADIGGDNLLRKAATLAPSSHLNQIPGAALQMQSEMRWFKEVERVMDPVSKVLLNERDPLEVFRESHKELRDEGEKWMKDTASSCSVVAALIVTIMFAAAFTVPGGNDQTLGYPIFLKENLFIFFITSDALSLFSSTTSVLTFLGILSSRYAEGDFLYSLPRKLIIGLSTLFLSIATMMMAFSATIIMMLQQRSYTWVYLPIIFLASVPVTVFVLLQFPLLVEIVSSTYAPVISRKKVKPWP